MTSAAHARVADPMKVGDWTIIPIRDGQWRQTPAELQRTAELFGTPFTGLGRDQADWDRHPELLHDDGTLEMTMGGYLLVGHDRVILVDTGVGPESIGELKGGELPGNLAVAGFSTTDVTDVVFTHFHVDHIGWASVDGRPYFPAATYRCHALELSSAIALKRLGAVEPVLERLETFEADVTLAPGLDVRLTAGHTPGSSSYVVSGAGERVMLIGDTVHCVHEFLYPNWSSLADDDAAAAARTRDLLAEELQATSAYAASGHFPGLGFGRLLSRENRSWTFARD